ncbi:hypothetical protein AB0875_12540 [Micromonospora gifhornensis]|uniref:hypothetical protein n=1 Tax=Micromonospora gifhornensis TaxID=84594 RepID=UPI003455EE1A
MAEFALVDATTWIGGYDFTGDLNQVQLQVSADELDSTTFGSGGFRKRIGGLRSVQASLAGFWSSATSAAPDPHVMPDLGVADRVVTMTPDGAEGSVAYFFQGAKFSTQMFGQIGEVTPFSVDVMGSNKVGLVRGQVLKAKGTVNATGATGSALELGEVADGQWLYAAFHVFSAGTTITAVLESDEDDDFADATTRATFGPITTTGGVWAARVAGPITDEWYRLRVSAVTGTFQIAGAAGIGS